MMTRQRLPKPNWILAIWILIKLEDPTVSSPNAFCAKG